MPATHPLLLVLLLTLLLTGCAGRRAMVAEEQQTIVAGSSAVTPEVFAMSPSFVLQGTQARHNRIGRVEAVKRQDREVVSINIDRPVIYAGSLQFTTSKGTYTNLVYRIHFPGTPFSLVPFHLGAGDNVGLLVLLTLNAQHRLILVTTANTCGCYAVSIPTEYTPVSLYPEGWPGSTLSVYGELLPARLPSPQDHETLQVVVRADVHRVRDLRIIAKETIPLATAQKAEVVGLNTLKALPLGDGTVTSLYYKKPPLRGHVKGAIKPWESLLLSWVSFDFFVGMDKEYGDTRESGNPFYTSLKPWNRSASDMNDFAAYLRFNGWKL